MIVAYVPDLMDRSKLSTVAAITFVTSPEQLAEKAADATIVIVDLTRPGVLESLEGIRGATAAPDSGTGARVIGFANHTRRELMEAARAAGCDQVLARSAFFSRLDQLLGSS